MSMPIQRQSESYGYFDDGPRFARDRTSTDLPRGLAALINTSGPRITGGMLNTRTAVNTDGMHPDDHAYHTELPPGRGGEVTWVDDAENYGRNPRREYNPDFGYEPTDEDERRQEGVAEDDDSGYNWGPEPRRHAALDGDHAELARLNDLSDQLKKHFWTKANELGDDQHPDLLPIARKWHEADQAGSELAKRLMYQTDPERPVDMNDRFGQRRRASRHPFDRVAADLAAPAAPQGPGHGFLPAHRVGLPWRDQVIPGTVIGLDGPQVGVRWDDGQYSSEEPHNIQLL